MKYVTLPGTKVSVSRIAMGCWALSGDSTWGPQEEKDSIAAIHAAMDAGINFFDTAELYGAGVSEEVLGKALQGKRDQVILASKFNQEHARREQVFAACEASLRRLRTNWIDLYQIHWRNREVPLEETWSALLDLQNQGKIRWIGVCNFGVGDLTDLLKLGKPLTNQLPYSLLFRAIEYEILPKCIQEGIGVLCYSPLTIGLLTGKYRSPDEVPPGRARTRHFSRKRPQTRHGEAGCEKETWEAMARIEAIAQGVGVSVVELALAWLLHQPGVTAVLAGIRNPRQARINAAAAGLFLPSEVLESLDHATRMVKEKLGPNPDMWETARNSRFR